MTIVTSTRAEMMAAREAHSNAQVAVVMTMGALHAGHTALMQHARRLIGPDGHLVVTVFVNPTQFAAGEDFERYPRTLKADVGLCAGAGVDVVFAPSVEEVYGTARDRQAAEPITVDPGPLGSVLEGAARPGHFRGVLTVVATLLHLTRPAIACFGEKDYQQLVLIRSMAEDLRFGVQIEGVETVREPDGLAMSSRNRYLGESERAAAAVVPACLEAAIAAAAHGPQAAQAAALEVLAREPRAEVDYVAITDPMLGAPIPGPGRVLVAVRIGSTRLIDNMACQVGAPAGRGAR